MNSKGIFIVIEGVDGSGKSTQAGKLAEWLEAHTGRKTVRTFEPFMLRELILGRKDLCATTELLLFLADRAEHVSKVITPTLNAGDNVICERYNDSTLAYQAGGHALELSYVRSLIEACKFPEPDVKIFLDISPEIAYSRVMARHNLNDKFEAEGLELIRKVSDFYRDFFVGPPPARPSVVKTKCDELTEAETFEQIISSLEALI